jgi:hypothetical protein
MTLRPWLPLALTLAATLAPVGAASALAIAHSVYVEVTGVAPQDDWDSAATEALLQDSILAQASGGGASATSSIGRFGDLGVRGVRYTVGEARTTARIRLENLPNPSNRDQIVSSHWVIDGGWLRILAGTGSQIRLDLSLVATTFNAAGMDLATYVWAAGVVLSADSGLATSGESIGAAWDLTGRVVIPMSFNDWEIGLVPVGGSIDFEYLLDIAGTGSTSVEFMDWGFSDPLQIGGESPFALDFAPAENGVPEPPSLALLAGALGLAGWRRRRLH